jgi:anion-transporting  ArsA/GET3 family ATPase
VVESAELAEEPVDSYEDDEYLDAPVIEPAADFEDVEEDTEAFLEKVFSQLEVNGQPEVEEEGHGLLRRRRMGSVLKEIEED